MTYEKPLKLRWSDLDPNMHIRHSVYYDFAAQVRTEFLFENGLTTDMLAKHGLGPILFREEAVFKRELHFGDDLTINLLCRALRRDASRFSFRHEIKRGDTTCAIINVDGAWIDTVERKLTAPPELIYQAFDQVPRTKDFEWQD